MSPSRTSIPSATGRAPRQPGLFDRAALPEGFHYQEDALTPEAERRLVERFAALDFRPFDFHGFLARRRVVSFGWRYDYGDGGLKETDVIPDFLLPLREIAGVFAGLAAEAFRQALVSEYAPGTPIGWHRDRSVFGDVVGISLLSAGTLRFRRKAGTKWERAAIAAAPRSIYLLSGPARTQWEHSIPPVESLRYSVTFRTLKTP